jgi:hypothetical protein
MGCSGVGGVPHHTAPGQELEGAESPSLGRDLPSPMERGSRAGAGSQRQLSGTCSHQCPVLPCIVPSEGVRVNHSSGISHHRPSPSNLMGSPRVAALSGSAVRTSSAINSYSELSKIRILSRALQRHTCLRLSPIPHSRHGSCLDPTKQFSKD